MKNLPEKFPKPLTFWVSDQKRLATYLRHLMLLLINPLEESDVSQWLMIYKIIAIVLGFWKKKIREIVTYLLLLLLELNSRSFSSKDIKAESLLWATSFSLSPMQIVVRSPEPSIVSSLSLPDSSVLSSCLRPRRSWRLVAPPGFFNHVSGSMASPPSKISSVFFESSASE